jgi:hypothetical protein
MRNILLEIFHGSRLSAQEKSAAGCRARVKQNDRLVVT